MSERSRVLVLGGGYAGTMAANRLSGRPNLDVTLINPRPFLVQRIRLHQLAARTGTVEAGYQRLLSRWVTLRVDSATLINHREQTVELAGGDLLSYDYLIYAVGSRATAPVPGVREHAHFVAEYETATELRAALWRAAGHDRVTVVGAGLTGVETASELAERGRRVILVAQQEPAAFLGPAGRAAVAQRLSTLGVSVRVSATVAEARHDALVLDGGELLPSGLTVWAGGFEAPDLARRSGLTTDGLGRLRTDHTLTSLDSSRIVAAGDAGAGLRMSCQAALPLGARAADTVISRVAGREPAALVPGFVGQNVSLGRRTAVVQATRRDDSPVGPHLGGRAGATIKELVSRGTLWFLRNEAARPGSYRWVHGPAPSIPVEAG